MIRAGVRFVGKKIRFVGKVKLQKQWEYKKDEMKWVKGVKDSEEEQGEVMFGKRYSTCGRSES